MKNWLIGLFALVSLSLVAGPANPNAIKTYQADGSFFYSFKKGDEHQRWTETLEGYSVVLNHKTKNWEFARKGKTGLFVPSGHVVRPDGIAPAGFEKHLRPIRHVEDERRTAELLNFKAYSQWEPQLVSGPRNLLFIAVNYADRALTTNPADWTNAIFGTTPGEKTVANYYKDNSFGLIQPVPVPNTQSNGVVEVTISKNHPNTGNANMMPARQLRVEQAWINEALAAASAHIDFPSLDTNGNGELSLDEAVIYFICAGWDASGSSKEPSVWGHKWGGSDVSVDGIQVRQWALNGELMNNDMRHSIGVITHELGHLMCQLPDLYDTQYNNSGMGSYSLMSGGSWGYAYGDTNGGDTPVNMDAWSRYVLGWSNPRTPGATDTVTFGLPLASQDAPVILRDETSANSDEYWLVENRYPSGWDLGMQPTLDSVTSVLTNGGSEVPSTPFTFTPAGTVTATAVLCGEGQVGEFPAAVNGQIALISRGTISFVDKVNNAKAAGALAAIIYNNTTGTLNGTLGGPGDYIPVIGIEQAAGPGLDGQTVTVDVSQITWEGGLLIQHIDVTVGTETGNNINSSTNAHQGVVVEEADSSVGSLLDTSGAAISGHAYHLFYAGNQDSFDDNTSPSATYYDGSASGLGIYNISAPGAAMTATMSPGPVGPAAPVANFSSAANQLTVSFTDNSADSDGSIVTWDWSFGDGNASLSQNPTHTYAAAGTYSVSLTVTDNDGMTDTHTASVTVSESVNQAPVADFSASVNNLDVNFTDASSDSDGSVVSWNWNFGDGNNSGAQNPSHSYAAAGTYTVTLTVTDNEGAQDSFSQDVTVTSGGSSTPTTDTFTGSVGGGKSVDYQISVADGSIDANLSWGSNHNLDLQLFDGNGNLVAESAGNANPETIVYDTAGVSGTYTLRVTNRTAGKRPNFTLTVNYNN